MLLFVKPDYLSRIRAGHKTTTIRPWKVCSLKPGAVLSFNGRVRVTITEVAHVRYGDLTDADAQADGFASRLELDTAFRSHYPGVTVDSLVWVLRFAPPIAA